MYVAAQYISRNAQTNDELVIMQNESNRVIEWTNVEELCSLLYGEAVPAL